MENLGLKHHGIEKMRLVRADLFAMQCDRRE
jgi:hypothetical protein